MQRQKLLSDFLGTISENVSTSVFVFTIILTIIFLCNDDTFSSKANFDTTRFPQSAFFFLYHDIEKQRHYIEQRIHIFTDLQNDNVGNVFILNLEKYGCPSCVYMCIHLYQENT